MVLIEEVTDTEEEMSSADGAHTAPAEGETSPPEIMREENPESRVHREEESFPKFPEETLPMVKKIFKEAGISGELLSFKVGEIYGIKSVVFQMLTGRDFMKLCRRNLKERLM